MISVMAPFYVYLCQRVLDVDQSRIIHKTAGVCHVVHQNCAPCSGLQTLGRLEILSLRNCWLATGTRELGDQKINTVCVLR